MNKQIKTLILSLVICFLNFGTLALCEGSEGVVSPGASIYVSPSGSDNNSGSVNSPFLTIEKAQTRAGMYCMMGYSSVTIYLREGRYNSFNLSASNAGKENCPIIYKAYPGEEAVISPAYELTSFNSLTEDKISVRIPAGIRENIVTYDLSKVGGNWSLKGMNNGQKVEMCSRLYFDGEPMNIARWPNEGYVKISDIGTVSDGKIIFNDGEKSTLWKNNTVLWAGGYFGKDWNFVRACTTEITESSISFDTNITDTSRVYFYNIPEELDSPGEYYIDPDLKKLYFYMPENSNGKKVMIANSSSPLTIDKCQYVSLEDLIIEGSKGDGVYLVNSNNITVSGCTIRNCGTDGVILSNSTDCTIKNNHIYNVGTRGVYCEQYENIENLTHGNVLVTNNRIHDYGQVTRTYAGGIYIYGVGNTVSHNEIYNNEHLAIRFGGNDNIFEYNEIHDVLTQTYDAGAIYVGRTWTNFGNKIRYNYIHDCNSTVGNYVVGIYLDDMMSGVECFGNIIDNVPLGIQLGGGHYNKIENNIIANSDDRDNIITSIYADSRGCEDWFKDTFDVSGDKTYIKDCIFIKEIINKGCLTKNVWIEKYPQIRKILETDFKKPQNNSIMKNIIYKHTNVKITQYVIDNGTVSDNVRFTSNPGFSNPQNGDYSFDTAPIEGFLPIPCDKIGIIEDGV